MRSPLAIARNRMLVCSPSTTIGWNSMSMKRVNRITPPSETCSCSTAPAPYQMISASAIDDTLSVNAPYSVSIRIDRISTSRLRALIAP